MFSNKIVNYGIINKKLEKDTKSKFKKWEKY